MSHGRRTARSRNGRWPIPLALAAIGLVPAGAAAADEGGWTLRIAGYYLQAATTPAFEDAAGTQLSSDNDYGAGIALSVEYGLSRHLGIEIGVSLADHGDFRARASAPDLLLEADDTMTLTTYAAALDVHLTPGSAADLHVGPVVALVDFGELTLRYDASTPPPGGAPGRVTFAFDDEVALGLDVGLDLALGDAGWLLYADARYLSASLGAVVTGASQQRVDYDPFTFGVGFGYRF